MLAKRILLITYHFPPSAASGTFRLLGFARHLPAHGWQPIVVAPPSLPWEPTDAQLEGDVPPEAIIERVPYPAGAPRWLRWFAQNAVWLPRAWSACKRVIEEHRPDVLLTSGPPHCVHALGYYLRKSTGLPWVADFRDPWITDGTSRTLSWMQWWTKRWERSVFDRANLILANAPNAARMFQSAYPDASEKIVTLTNGFDPHSEPRPSASEAPTVALRWRSGSDGAHARPPHAGETDALRWRSGSDGARARLLHAGEIYAGRDPVPLLEAVATLNATTNDRFDLTVLGRNETDLDELLHQRGWVGFVRSREQCGYHESLAAMSDADILVLLDSPGRTIGVPAKLYEYFRAGKPILALAERDGDTATILRESGVLHRIASPRDSEQIRRALLELLDAMRDGQGDADPSRLHRFTRAELARTLAGWLDALIGRPTVVAERIAIPSLQEADA